MRLSKSPLLVALVIILSLGLSVIWSTIPSLVASQAVALLMGIVALLLLSRLDAQWLFQLKWPFYWLSVVLLVITEVLGITTRGSTRWINLGLFNFQTSEFIKPALIVSFAAFLSMESSRSGWRRFLIQLCLIGLPSGLIFLQPDLGSALSLLIIWVGMVAGSKLPKKYLALLFLLVFVSAPFGLKVLKPYQRERIESFINPFSDPAGSGYNVIQSMIAVGSGQLIGKGVRQGTQSHLRFLPERHTDFAFASFAEEFGFIGVSILLGCFFILLNWLLTLSKHTAPFGELIIIGLFWWIFGQLVINIGMNMGILPVTGITLPLFSYGGSSLMSLFIGFGLVAVFARSIGNQIDI